ncbi:Tn3 family transposase, partial [Klebsiella pneumoniae]|uniref:Tn3 family transposase n=1 Tax=Klebsiella pneumoniae TaxID=573 RepID=UPI001F4A3C70
PQPPTGPSPFSPNKKNDVRYGLCDVGCFERYIFIFEWNCDTDMQRRDQIGLNKGEGHHALKNALRSGRQGEIRDRTTAGQHYRIAGRNLLTAVIIYWNTGHLGHAVTDTRNEGFAFPPPFLPHMPPGGAAPLLTPGDNTLPQRGPPPQTGGG